MLSRLEPKGISICGSAEALPLRSAWFDVVAAATSFHWFDPAVAVPEMRRVLRPAGTVALLNNIRDERVAWVSALSRLIGSERDMVIIPGGADRMAEAFAARLTGHGLFKNPEHRIFHHRQQLTEERLAALVQSRSYVAIMEAAERRSLLDAVRELVRTHPDLAGRSSFELPYLTHVWRASASD